MIYIYSLISFIIFTILVFALLSKKLALRMDFFESRRDLLTLKLKKDCCYLISLKKEQEEDIELFYKAVRRIRTAYNHPVHLYWIDEASLEEYALIIETINMTETPCLLFCNEQGEVEYDDVFKFL